MSDNWSSDLIAFKPFKSVAINCWPSLPDNWTDTKSVVEDILKVSVTAPIERSTPKPFKDDSLQVRFEPLDLIVIFIYHLCFAALIHKDPAKPHFKRRALKGFGEFVGRPGVGVKLGMDDLEYFVGEATIEAVVDLLAIPFGEGIGVGGGGVDYFGH